MHQVARHQVFKTLRTCFLGLCTSVTEKLDGKFLCLCLSLQLDVLSGHSTASNAGCIVDGELLVNGAPRTKEFRKISAYVQQNVVLLSTATVGSKHMPTCIT